MQAAEARARWRAEQGAISFNLPEADIKVSHPYSVYSWVNIHAEDNQDSPAQQLVSELMILAGEAIGSLGTRA